MALGRAVFAVVAAVAVPPSPLADVPRVAPETVVETMTVRVHHGWAELTSRVTLRNPDDEAGEAQATLVAAPRGVFVGLRSYAPAGSGRAFSAELLPLAAAQSRYDRSTVAPSGLMDSVLLRWAEAGRADLRVYPLLPGVDKTVEYDTLLPTTYEGGVDVVEMPSGDNALGASMAALWAADPDDELTVDGRIVAPGTRISIADEHKVGVRRHVAPPLDGALASIALPTGRTLERMRITAAPRMGEAPRGAKIVLALDTSRSNDSLPTMMLAARAYLEHMPEAEVLLVTFDRHARALTTDFLPVARAIDVLARLQVERRNGSEVGEALALADARLLAEKPGPRRVIVLTDFRTRDSLHPERLPPVRSGAIVHLADVVHGRPSTTRDDESSWATAARPTGGVVWHATANRLAVDAKAMATTFEEWARPVRIDRVRVTSTPAFVDLGVAESLEEGEGFEMLGFTLKGAHAGFAIEGEVWSRPFRTWVAADPREADRWSALVLGDALSDSLEESEVRALASRGHALSSQTSFVCAAAGERPPDEGGGLGISGGGTGSGFGTGMGRLGTIGHGSAGSDFRALLRLLLLPGWHTCGGAGTPVTVTLETTGLELVDVVKVETASPLRAACMREASWEITLPGDFAGISSTFEVTL